MLIAARFDGGGVCVWGLQASKPVNDSVAHFWRRGYCKDLTTLLTLHPRRALRPACDALDTRSFVAFTSPLRRTVGLTRSRALHRIADAAVSYMDSNVGKVLDALDDLGFAENTVVGFFADHGYQIGEHGMWEKYVGFDGVPIVRCL